MAEYRLTPTQSRELGDIAVTTTDDHDPAAAIDAGECPWCDAYDGDHVERHAPKAHPDDWEAYRDG